MGGNEAWAGLGRKPTDGLLRFQRWDRDGSFAKGDDDASVVVSESETNALCQADVGAEAPKPRSLSALRGAANDRDKSQEQD